MSENKTLTCHYCNVDQIKGCVLKTMDIKTNGKKINCCCENVLKIKTE